MQCRHCQHINHEHAVYCGHCGLRLSLAIGAAPTPRAPLSMALLAPNTRLGEHGRYLILKLLGAGGFGQAYHALDLGLHKRHCVIKRLVIDPSASADEREQIIASFTREVQLLGTLATPGHPAIPDIYDYLAEDYCLVMKYVAGESLARRLSHQVGGLPEPEVTTYGHMVCSALVYLHDRLHEPVLHRDVKPENILLDSAGRIWLIDFGVSKALSASLLHTKPQLTKAAGTPGYMPPEQWRGRAEPRSDVYALAMTMVRLLTNRTLPTIPMEPEAVATLLPSTLRPELRGLLLRSTALAVIQRPTAAEFLAALNAINLELPPPQKPLPLPLAQPFIGRTTELATFSQQLQHSGLLALIGFAGVGKTALAAHIADQIAPDRHVFWYQCYIDAGSDTFVHQLAEFLAWHGRPELRYILQRQRAESDKPVASSGITAALAAISDQSVLICIDDAHLVEGHAGFGQIFAGLSWLARRGQAMTLLTSRQQPEHIAAQNCMQLVGLNATETGRFLERTKNSLPAEITNKIYQLTEGNPQLLILTSELLQHSDDPERLSTRLSGAPHVSEYLLREVDTHLSDAERAVMSGLAALSEYGVTQRALEAALELGGLYRALIGLQQRQLLSSRTTGDEPIYTQHALVRAFYSAALSRPEARHLHRRAATYYAHEAHDPLRAALHYHQAQEIRLSLALLTPDTQRFLFTGETTLVHRVLTDIAASAAAQEVMLTPAESIGLALAQGEVATFRGQRAEAQHSFEAALAQLAITPTEEAIRREQARACRGMGQVLESEQPQAALQWFERGLEAIDGTNPLEQARISNRMGYLHLQLGTLAKARSILEAALVSLPVEQIRMRADLLVNLGSVCAASGAYKTGREHLHAALPMMRRIGNRWAEAGILQNLGMIFDISGDWEAAEASYRQALKVAEELGETQRRSEVLLALGILQTNRSQYTSALAYLEQALALADAQGARVNCVYIYSSLADLYVRMGRIESAAITAKHAEDWAEKLGERSQLPEILRTQALVALGQNEQTLALALAERALALAHEQGNAEDTGQCLRVRAEVSLAHNDVLSALADCAASVTLLAENPYQHAQTQLVWGKALTISGDSDSGAHQIELARTAFTRLGIQI